MTDDDDESPADPRSFLAAYLNRSQLVLVQPSDAKPAAASTPEDAVCSLNFLDTSPELAWKGRDQRESIPQNCPEQVETKCIELDIENLVWAKYRSLKGGSFYYCGRLCPDTDIKYEKALIRVEMSEGRRLVEFFNVPKAWKQKIFLVDVKDIRPYNAEFKPPHKASILNEWDASHMDYLSERMHPVWKTNENCKIFMERVKSTAKEFLRLALIRKQKRVRMSESFQAIPDSPRPLKTGTSFGNEAIEITGTSSSASSSLSTAFNSSATMSESVVAAMDLDADPQQSASTASSPVPNPPCTTNAPDASDAPTVTSSKRPRRGAALKAAELTTEMLAGPTKGAKQAGRPTLRPGDWVRYDEKIFNTTVYKRITCIEKKQHSSNPVELEGWHYPGLNDAVYKLPSDGKGGYVKNFSCVLQLKDYRLVEGYKTFEDGAPVQKKITLINGAYYDDVPDEDDAVAADDDDDDRVTGTGSGSHKRGVASYSAFDYADDDSDEELSAKVAAALEWQRWRLRTEAERRAALDLSHKEAPTVAPEAGAEKGRNQTRSTVIDLT